MSDHLIRKADSIRPNRPNNGDYFNQIKASQSQPKIFVRQSKWYVHMCVYTNIATQSRLRRAESVIQGAFGKCVNRPRWNMHFYRTQQSSRVALRAHRHKGITMRCAMNAIQTYDHHHRLNAFWARAQATPRNSNVSKYQTTPPPNTTRIIYIHLATI